MRKFKLINSRNQELNLTNKNKYILTNPDGLGFSIKYEQAKIKNNYIKLESVTKQKEVSGVLIVKSYQLYKEFISFIRFKPLRLCYSPTGNDKWYYLDCEVNHIKKTEISKVGILECPIDFIGFSQWYETVLAKRLITKLENTKKYTYGYPYIYNDTRQGKLEISSNSTDLIPAKITILGKAINPVWSLIQNEKVLYNGSLPITIEQENKAVINAKPGELEISEYSKDGEYIRNLYQLADVDTSKFVFIPPGESILKFSAQNITDTVEVFIEFEVSYESV